MADYPVSIDQVRRELIKLRDGFRVPVAKVVVNMSIASLEGLPQMDAVPVVHGRWEDATEIIAGIRHPQTRCTACEHVYWGYHGSKYCPNCGAKMDGEEVEADG